MFSQHLKATRDWIMKTILFAPKLQKRVVLKDGAASLSRQITFLILLSPLVIKNLCFFQIAWAASVFDFLFKATDWDLSYKHKTFVIFPFLRLFSFLIQQAVSETFNISLYFPSEKFQIDFLSIRWHSLWGCQSIVHLRENSTFRFPRALHNIRLIDCGLEISHQL